MHSEFIVPEKDVATSQPPSIVPPMIWNWKWLHEVALVALVVLSVGCSGIHASKSVSPATFLLPGLMKNEHPAAQDSIPALPGELLAQK